jgi:hypothetical protein
MTALQDLSQAIDTQMATLAGAETNLRATSDYLERERIDPGTTLYQAQLVYTGANRQTSNVVRDQITTVMVLAHRLADTADERSFVLDYAGTLSKWWTDEQNWVGLPAPGDFIWSVISLDADEAWERIGNVMQWSVRAVLATQ